MCINAQLQRTCGTKQESCENKHKLHKLFLPRSLSSFETGKKERKGVLLISLDPKEIQRETKNHLNAKVF